LLILGIQAYGIWGQRRDFVRLRHLSRCLRYNVHVGHWVVGPQLVGLLLRNGTVNKTESEKETKVEERAFD